MRRHIRSNLIGAAGALISVAIAFGVGVAIQHATAAERFTCPQGGAVGTACWYANTNLTGDHAETRTCFPSPTCSSVGPGVVFPVPSIDGSLAGSVRNHIGHDLWVKDTSDGATFCLVPGSSVNLQHAYSKAEWLDHSNCTEPPPF